MKQVSSAISTSPEAPSSQIGMPRGEHGLETHDSSPRLREWLASRHPREVDRAAVLQASRQGVALDVMTDFVEVRDAKGTVTGARTVPRVVRVGGTPEARAEVRGNMVKLLTPADDSSVEGWLAELSVLVSRRAEDQFTETLRLTAYAKRLMAYPADVARAALLDHPWKFWPSWAELKAVCDEAVAPRLAMIAALEKPPPPRQPPKERITPERAQEIINEIYGKDQGND